MGKYSPDPELDQLLSEQMGTHAEDAELNQFLSRISQIESSGGKDLNHQEIQNGMHAGTSAIGQYGLMPVTVQDLAKKASNAQVRELTRLPASEVQKRIVASPDIEHELARKLAERVLSKNHGDQEMAAYAWNQGQSLSPEQIQARKYQDSNYVQKFRKLINRFRGG